LQDLGYTPWFISTEQIERDELEARGCRVLVLPDSHAFSPKEISRIQAWRENLRLVASSGSPAAFDLHGRRREGSPPLPGPAVRKGEVQRVRDVAGSRVTETVPDETRFRETVFSQTSASMISYAKDRRSADSGQVFPERQRFADDLMFLKKPIVTPSDLCVRTHRYRLGSGRLVAFERGVDYHMSEDLKQAGGNEALEKPVSFRASLRGVAHVYDLRTGAYLGERGDIPVDLDPWKPSLFALMPEKLPEGSRAVDELLKSIAPGSR
jgi:hypothetical protein